MQQLVIASKDVDILINFDAIGVPYKLKTGATLGENITGNTESIHAISTAEPIATDNSNTEYDINVSLQRAEADDIKDALATATVDSDTGSIVHIRQIIEGATISVVRHKRRSVPAVSVVETYLNCTGVEESDTTERASTETLKQWNFKARGMTRVTVPL